MITIDQNTLFPANPSHGDIFELEPGLLLQYDGTVNSWAVVASGSVKLPLATTRKPGAMSYADLRKLNRLVLPPPQASLTGNDCVAPFKHGMIDLLSGDDFIDVNGKLDITNIDQYGDTISEVHPFQIHQHTYGFDFTLDIPNLIQELIKREQIKLVGATGDKGETGDTGDDGIDNILTGPAGEKGEQGLAPGCDLSIENEIVSANAKSGLKRALVKVRVIPDTDDPTKYSLQFDRQAVGQADASVSLFNVRGSKSYWVIAVSSIAAAPQTAYYLDIEPIVEAVHQKFLSEVDRLKKGYEDIVAFWIQTMSDLFDEQKHALCCALEFCMSKRKSVELRRHMESVASAAIGSNGAQIRLHGRQSGKAVEISNTRLMGQRIPGAPDLCASGPPFPQAATQAESSAINISVDPLLNAGSAKNAKAIELEPGKYSAIITGFDARIGATHGGVVRIQYVEDGVNKTIQFLDKGNFESLLDARAAYEGLSVGFTHDGGNVHLYFPMIPNMNVAGQVDVRIERSQRTEQPSDIKAKPAKEKKNKKRAKPESPESLACQMTLSHLSWYKKGWDNGHCCGLVTNIAGQDYIIFKRSIGDDIACGGGETAETPCIAAVREELGLHPAFAWPTLDGHNFVQLPNVEYISFQFDEILNDLVTKQIAATAYSEAKGNPAGYRHLAHQLSVVLFPCV